MGPFTASFQYSSIGTGTNLTLSESLSNSAIAGVSLLAGGTHTLTFTKTDTQIKVYVDGNLLQSKPSTRTTGYYLSFDLQGANNLQIQNLSVVRGATTPTPVPPTLTASCSANPSIILAGQSTTFSGTSSGGTGTRTGVWGGVVSGTSSSAVYSTSISAPASFGKATYKVTDSGNPKQVVPANCSVQINAPVLLPFSVSCSHSTNPATMGVVDKVTMTQKMGLLR